MINITNVRKSKKESNKGITLIALVITIIVLLILATVSIATLTGENGILTKANTAKELTIEAEEKEQINLAYTTVMADKLHSNSGNDLTVTADELKQALDNQNAGVKTASKDDNQIEVTFTKSGNVYTVDGRTGEIIGTENGGGEDYNTATDVTGAITQNKPFETKTEIHDTFGNKVVVPEGFKIASDSGNNVTEGVVIEDVSYGETVGSQFVWIPVGTVHKNVEKTESMTITLGRYVFKENGTIDTSLSKTEPKDQLKLVLASQTKNSVELPGGVIEGSISGGSISGSISGGSISGSISGSSGYYIEGLKEDTTTNTHAKDIVSFRKSASDNGGYWIGRYEARVANKRTAKTTNDAELEKVTVKASDFVYNYVTQPQAAKLARAMYEGDDKTFTSDLINSYAWDTAIVFLQEFDNRETARTKPYSGQNSLNTGSVAERGTNNLTDINQQDKICNIWDMASNDFEWTTETYTDTSSNGPCVSRGGSYSSSSYTSYRNYYSTTGANGRYSFRLALYL